jgi:protein-disulfide isomerase/uncharacterized membrane protein
MNIRTGSVRISVTVSEIAIWLGVTAGFVLSIISQLKICSACSETAQYRILGLEFGWVGITWFGILIIIQLLKNRYELFHFSVPLALFASAGAECHFIWIQKYEIGQWCPICLGIAAAVFLACAATVSDVWSNKQVQGVSMKSRWQFFLTATLALILGLGGSLLGTGNVSRAAEADLFLGKSGSQTTVYVVSDWFCPVCRKLEPEIDRLIPALAKSVRLGFVDFPIHKETLNFTPYNLQFLTYEKEKYPALRKALAELALKTKKPTDAEVQSAIAPLGVKLREISYADTLAGMQANMTFYQSNKIKSTPSVVIANTRTGKSKTLVGEKQINEVAIKAAIAEVEKP